MNPAAHESPTEIKIRELQYQVATYEDPVAYKTLFFILFPSLQNFAFSILKSRVWAEEIASDMLMEVWSRRAKLLEIENLRLYLFISTKHACLHKLKSEKKEARFSVGESEVEFISDYANPGETAELHELEASITAAIRSLPPSCQLIYKLAKEDKLKYKDIAQLLDISIKTIDSQLAIALRKIARSLHLNPSKRN
ncbi:MAG: sigma-70 family RNA polymerase sigma factor [Ferruginibacter sp.]